MIEMQDFATLINKYHPHSETVIAVMHQPNKKVLPEKHFQQKADTASLKSLSITMVSSQELEQFLGEK